MTAAVDTLELMKNLLRGMPAVVEAPCDRVLQVKGLTSPLRAALMRAVLPRSGVGAG